jgi:hypothetical protein
MLGNDDTESMATVGEVDPKTMEMFELSDDDFQVVVTMAPNNNTRREEATTAIMELIQAVPQITPLIYDIFIGGMDFPGAQAIAERLKKTIPPELLEEQGGEQQMVMTLQKMQGQIKQDQQIIQTLSQQMEMLGKELETKGIENKTKYEIAKLDAQSKIIVANINALSDDNDRATKMSQFWFGITNQMENEARQRKIESRQSQQQPLQMPTMPQQAPQQMQQGQF